MTVKDFSSSDLDTFKNEIIEGLKSIKYDDLEDIVYRMELTYNGIRDVLDIKYIAASTTG